jgi:hypothetical protein
MEIDSRSQLSSGIIAFGSLWVEGINAPHDLDQFIWEGGCSRQFVIGVIMKWLSLDFQVAVMFV